MNKPSSNIELKLIIMKILKEQEQSLESTLNHYLSLSSLEKEDELFLKTILPIFQAVNILYKENRIDNKQYSERLQSLIKLYELSKKV
ncbi:hypothetical protein ACXYMX_16580 [Sporosarcina sp. CAU 1771]